MATADHSRPSDRKYWDEELATRFSRPLKSVTGVTAAIRILPPDTLPQAVLPGHS